MEINSKSEKTVTETSLGGAQRLGEFLHHARISQKKSLADIAKELKISEKRLLALEADQYKELPEAPFIKGYYRAYAKLLNVDISALLARFDDVYKQDTGMVASHALADSPIKEMGRLASSGRRGLSKWVKRIVILVIAVLILWILYAVINNVMLKHKTNNAQQNNEQVIELTTNTASSNLNQTAMTGDQLSLEFNQPTEVMISDSTGKTLLQGRQESNINLSGQAPFDIRIDNAKVVKLKLNDENINLVNHTSADGSATFKLAP